MMKLISSCIGKKGVSIIVLIFFTFVFIPSLMATNGEENGTPQTGRISMTAFIVAASIIIIAFMGILILGWLKDRNLDKGEMRRAIAGTFVVGFTMLMVLCLRFGIYQKEVVIAYIELVGIVIGFYFGAKIAGEKKTDSEDIKSAQSEESEIKELKKKIIDYYNANSSDQGKVVTAINNTGYTDWKNFIGGRPGEPSLRNLEQIKEELKI